MSERGRETQVTMAERATQGQLLVLAPVSTPFSADEHFDCLWGAALIALNPGDVGEDDTCPMAATEAVFSTLGLRDTGLRPAGAVCRWSVS